MPTDPLVHCQRCSESMPPPQLLEHVRLLHPDVEVEPVEAAVRVIPIGTGLVVTLRGGLHPARKKRLAAALRALAEARSAASVASQSYVVRGGS